MGLTAVILIVLGIVLLTAFYVAAEISLAGSRRSRMQELREEGNARAGAVLHIIESPSRLSAYIATCQISITICSIVLGFVGQGWLATYVEPLVSRWGQSQAAATTMSSVAILVGLSLAQVFFGELIPKNVGIRIPEQLAMGTVRPLIIYHALFTPFLFFFNLANGTILRLLGFRVTHDHGMTLTPEEIQRLTSKHLKEGDMPEEEQRLLATTLQLDEIQIGHIMTPRERIFAAPASFAPETWTRMLVSSPFSRMPIFRESLDDIYGAVHLLDLLCAEADADPDTELVYDIERLPRNMPVRDALRFMQERKAHLALVSGSEGATVGIVTLEEVVEAVMGSIEDEFDAEPPQFWIQSRGRILLDAALSARQMAKFLGASEKDVASSAQAGRHRGPGQLLQVEAEENGQTLTWSADLKPEMLERLEWLQRTS